MACTLLESERPTDADMAVAEKSASTLSRIVRRGRPLKMNPENGDAKIETIEIPAPAVPIIQAVLDAMARGEAVSVAPVHAELTTQQAAHILGVSRPFLIGLLDQKALPYSKVGKHRRIILKDVIDYRRRSQAERQKILDRISEESQKLGVGY